MLDDMDLATAAKTLAKAECGLNGQVCSSLTRVIVSKGRHDELMEALASSFGATRVGDPFDATSQLGPLVSDRQRDRVLGHIKKGVDGSAIGREEIFGVSGSASHSAHVRSRPMNRTFEKGHASASHCGTNSLSTSRGPPTSSSITHQPTSASAPTPFRRIDVHTSEETRFGGVE